MVGRSTKFDQENIDRIVGDVIGFMEATPTTRSAGTRTVAEIRPLVVTIPTHSVGTRSDDETPEETQEELFYLVNFDDDQGYSIIAADHRIKDEIALFVGNGNLDETEVENPGLAIMLSRLDDYAARSIAQYEAWCDSVEVALLGRMTPEEIEIVMAQLRHQQETRANVINQEGYGPWETFSQVEPMIPVEWGQKGVFNDRAEEKEGADVAAGCVAIATMQLMSYWKHPTVYHGVTMHWDTAIQYSGDNYDRSGAYKTWLGPMSSAPDSIKNAVADYIWYIGEDINMNFGVNGSGAYSQDAINLLIGEGYFTSTKMDYSEASALNSLENNCPVYMRGNDPSLLGGGHAWLLDGFIKQERYEDVWVLMDPVPSPTFLERVYHYREFFHNNWGWDGGDNGYYLADLFDPINDPDLPSNTRNYNFSTNLEMWTNIYK